MERRSKSRARRTTPSAGKSALHALATAATSTDNFLVVYVHGIGNKPVESVLKAQWDRALFGVDMGDRTRMAYWVNRARYPIPEPAPPESGDRLHTSSIETTRLHLLSHAQASDPDALIHGITSNAKHARALRRIAERMRTVSDVADEEPTDTAAARAGLRAYEVREKVIPLPGPARDLIARILTRIFLQDVHDFLYDAAERKRMEDVLRQRIASAAGQVVVVAHSQGTMIAYDVLRSMPSARVPLLVTMGSPLGMDEVKDELRKWMPSPGKLLPRPAGVGDWLNVAERLDPVAIDNDLSNDYAGVRNESGLRLNPEWARDPHSATGYLSTSYVHDAVGDAVGSGFAQPVRPFVVARDLTKDLADGDPINRRHSVLLQLKDLPGGSMAAARSGLVAELKRRMPRLSDDELGIDELQRYVAARLTREEVEWLHQHHERLKVGRIWRNAAKRALLYDSARTIQAQPAQVTYNARGQAIEWAVLDTGIRADHPHFATHLNVSRLCDCTKRGPVVEAAYDPKTYDPHRKAKRPSPAVDRDGHGTHVAATIAGESVAELSSRTKTGPQEVRLRGMAPEVKLHAYKVLDDQGNGDDGWIIKALDHIATVNDQAGGTRIAGVNLSLGGDFDPDVFGCGHTPLCEELRRLWRQGVLVCLAAGNEGFAILRSDDGPLQANIDLSIGDPANLEEAIAVGAIHKSAPHTYGVSYFSSRGPTADGRQKPDVVAPGERIVSARHDFKAAAKQPYLEDFYVEMSGTSMACPHVSGILAAFLSVRPEFVGRPDEVKALLLETCTDLQRDPYIQGRGMPNLMKMLLNA